MQLREILPVSYGLKLYKPKMRILMNSNVDSFITPFSDNLFFHAKCIKQL